LIGNGHTFQGSRLAGCLGFVDPFVGIDFYFEEIGDEGIHAGIHHENGAVGRVENRKIQDGSQKILVFAKLLNPGFKLNCPFFFILFKIIFTFKNKGQLVVAVIGKAEYACQIDIKFVEVCEAIALVCLDFPGCFILNSQRIVPHHILNLHKIHHVLQKCLLKR